VFWIPVTSVENMKKAYVEVGRLLRIPNIESKEANVLELVQRRLEQEYSYDWLLIFDNADDIDLWMDKAVTTPASDRRIDYLPRSKHGSILFTTRNLKAAVKLAPANVVSIDEMDSESAKALLQKSLINKALLTDAAATNDLLTKLTCLPLALIQATAYINENTISLSEFMSLFDETEENKIKLLCHDFEDEGRYRESKNPIATTWLISFARIRDRHPFAAALLSFMACLEAKSIPKSLLPSAQTSIEAVEALATLTAYSFVTNHRTDDLLDIHRLVHLTTRNWLREEGLLQQWALKVLRRINEAVPPPSYENLGRWKTYVPHIRYTLDLQLEPGVECEKEPILQKLVNHFNCDGRYKDSADLYLRVMELRARTYGEEHPVTIYIMITLAESYILQRRLKDAVGLSNKGIDISRRVHGEEHPETLRAEYCLTRCMQLQERWNEAETALTKLVAKSERVLGEEHAYTLYDKADLALTYYSMGWWEKAEEIQLQLREVYKRKYGEDSIKTLNHERALAETYRSQKRLDESADLQMRLLERAKTSFGVEVLWTLSIANDLTVTYYSQARWNEAEELLEGVVKTTRRVYGEHEILMMAMYNLALVRMKQKREHEAISLMEECVSLVEKIYDTGDPYAQWSIQLLEKWKKPHTLPSQPKVGRSRIRRILFKLGRSRRNHMIQHA
jgi:tetratricopeptide (TPR) repeat protein